MLNKILFLCCHANLAFASTFLGSEQACRISLDVSAVADVHHHVLFGNDVFHGYLACFLNNLCPSFISKLFFNLLKLVNNNLYEQFFACKYLLKPLYEF